MAGSINWRTMRNAVGLMLVAASALNAQGGSLTIIAGTVKGANGIALSGAVVSAQSEDSVTRKAATSDQPGKYQIIFSRPGAVFHLTVKAGGYIPWTGDVRRAYNDDRIVTDIVLKEGGTAADWPAPSVSPFVKFTRAQLASDAIDVTVDAGDITIMGTQSDTISYIAYSSAPSQMGATASSSTSARLPVSASALTLPTPISVRGTYTLGANGLSIVSGGGNTLVLRVPRNLKSLKLTVTGQGNVRVGNFDGGLTVQSADGSVDLTAIGGPALVEARNGRIDASIATIPEAMNFLGHNGDITLTLPAEARASLSGEAHHGSIAFDSTRDVVTRKINESYDVARGDVAPTRIGMTRKNPDPANTGDTPIKAAWISNGGGAAVSLITLNGNIVIHKLLPKME